MDTFPHQNRVPDPGALYSQLQILGQGPLQLIVPPRLPSIPYRNETISYQRGTTKYHLTSVNYCAILPCVSSSSNPPFAAKSFRAHSYGHFAKSPEFSRNNSLRITMRFC